MRDESFSTIKRFSGRGSLCGVPLIRIHLCTRWTADVMVVLDEIDIPFCSARVMDLDNV